MFKTTVFKTLSCMLAAASILLLAACSEAGNGGPTASSAVQSSTPDGQETSANGQETAPASSPANGQAGQSGQAGQASETPSIGQLVALAKEGKIPEVNYAAHIALFDEIEQDWGKADSTEAAGKGIYAAYTKRGVTIGFNKGMKVFDMRSYATNLQQLSYADIEKSLGKADETATNGDDQICVYKVNDQYQLKFIIPKATGKVDHISVFSPQDAKNNMAG
ncbi:YjgB family protein [Paenibacillus sp. FSL H8-0537]|uniref:YjgB family protein n=1 Tax=Paenibacillus sp. FSL H8-0537 TaxID=2921399 RepID=UPI003100DFA0